MSTAVVVLSPSDLEALINRAVGRAVAAIAPAAEEAEVMTREQAAELLQVNPHAIPKLVREGLPSHRLGTQWRFRRSELLAWLSAR